MPINATHEYFTAEKKYLEAESLEDKIYYLEELIRVAPKHKGAENLLAELKTRLKKFREKQEKSKKVGKSSRKVIKKEYFQCALVGLPNSGKSSIMAKLTNANPLIADYPYSTKEAEVGILDYNGVKIQIVDIPPVGSENFDKNIANSADLLLIVVCRLEDIEKLSNSIERARGAKLYLFNKVDLLSTNEKRKLGETLKSKKIPSVMISARSEEGFDELKKNIFLKMNIIRVYTKEPGKQASKEAIVLPKGSSVKNVAEKIGNNFLAQIKSAYVTGPSSKFPNQKVGLAHICKDLDVIEFHGK